MTFMADRLKSFQLRWELDGFQNIIGSDIFGAAEVVYGARDLKDAVVGAGGQIHLLHGEVASTFGVELQHSRTCFPPMTVVGIGFSFPGFAFKIRLIA